MRWFLEAETLILSLSQLVRFCSDNRTNTIKQAKFILLGEVRMNCIGTLPSTILVINSSCVLTQPQKNTV